MIKIFPSSAKEFLSNGLIAIKPNELKEYKKKSLNGWYIECEIPVRFKDYILKDNLCVVKSKSKMNPQAFRINDIQKNADTIIFVADHVMFDAQNYMLTDVRPTNKTALTALTYINERTDIENPFTYISDVETTSTAYFIFKNLLEAWEVIEERWEGVFDADNWSITFSNSLGKNVGEMLVYNKKLDDILITEDWSNVVTRIYPQGDNDLRLPELYIDSDIQYPLPYTKNIQFSSELVQEEKDEIPEEVLIEELRKKTIDYLEKNKYPQVSYEVTADIVETYDINDIIAVKHPLVNLKTEVQEYTYNHKTKKTENLVFGNYTRDVKKKFNSIKESISTISKKISENDKIVKTQTNIINTLNKLGHLYIADDELLILDSLPKETAKNVLRIGLGGIGFSHNGYEGPFETAWTLDGSFNANFIKSGKISANLIEGLDELLLNVSEVKNLIQETKSTHYVLIENAAEGNLLKLSIYGNFCLLYPENQLFPGNDVFPLDSYLIIQDEVGNKKKIHLPIDFLNYIDDSCYDEFIIDSNETKIIRRVGLDSNKNLIPLEKEKIVPLDKIEITIKSGKTKIWLESFYDKEIHYVARYGGKSDLTNIFALRTEVSASVKILKDNIELKTSKKIDNDKVIASINMSPEAILIAANKLQISAEDILNIISGNEINLKSRNINITSDNFSVDKNGNVNINGGNIYLSNGGKVVGGDGLLTNLFFRSSGNYGTYSKIGFDAYFDDYGNMTVNRANIYLDVFIPDNFSIKNANLVLQHSGAIWSSYRKNVNGYARNIKLYKVSAGSYTINNSYNILQIEDSKLSEMPNILGVSSYNPSENIGMVETKISKDISSYISKGHNIFVAKSNEPFPAMTNEEMFTNEVANKTGVGCLSINIIGYMKMV